MDGLRNVFGRVKPALLTWPNGVGWLRAVWELLWAVPVVLLCGWLGGFMRFTVTDDMADLVMLAIVAIFAPAIGEEILFRATLLPRPEESRLYGKAILVSVVAFVAWHPLQALIFGPGVVPIFLDPWFLLAVAVLGLALARIYRATASLWPCVLAHWLVVVGWKAFFGGPPGPFS
ncbi:MAG: CPBP family glutamic-type intramembrane protease [Parasphingopyxis sp.]